MAGDLDDLKTIHRDAGELVATRARDLVPRVSGALGGTIRLSVRKSGVSILAGRAAVPYAGPIHFGWTARNIRAQPFLFDARAQRADDVVRRYEDRVAALVVRVGAETP